MRGVLTAWLLLLGFASSADTYFWRGGSFGDYGQLANWTNETGAVSRLPDAGDRFYAYENRALDLNGVRTIGGWDSASDGNWSRYLLELTNGVLNVVGTVRNHSDTIIVHSGATLDFRPESRYEIAYNDAEAHKVSVKSGGRLGLHGDTWIYKLELTVDAGGVLDLSPVRLGIYGNTAQASFIMNSGELLLTNGLALASGSTNGGRFSLRQVAGRMSLSGRLSDGAVPGSNSFSWEGGTLEALADAAIDFAQASVAARADVTLRVAPAAVFDFGSLAFGAGSVVTVVGGGKVLPPRNPAARLVIEEGQLLVTEPGSYDLSCVSFGARGRLAVDRGLSAVREGDVLTATPKRIGRILGASVLSPEDACANLENPACGKAGGWWTGLKNDGTVITENLSGNCSKLWSLEKFSKGYLYDNRVDEYTNRVQRFVGGADIPLNEGALLSISNTLLSVRRNGGSVVTRIAYTWDGYGGCECDDFEMVLTHIRQVAAIYNCFTDVVAAVECGVIGAYGEMHTSRYCGAEHSNRVIDTWLTSMDPSIPLLLRGPNYLLNYIGEKAATVVDDPTSLSPEKQARLNRLGFYNDGYLGTWWDYGTWGAMTREQGCEYLRTRPHLPYGGEFATVNEEFFNGSYNAWKLFDPSEYNLVREWYETHLNYLRTIESTGMTIYREMEKRTFRVSDYVFPGMPDLHEYDGKDLRTFCRDHMGARYVVRAVRADPGCTNLTLSVENTGFSSSRFPLCAQVSFVQDSEVFTVPAEILDDLPGPCARRSVRFRFARPSGLRPSERRWLVHLRLFAPLADEDAFTESPRRPFRFANPSDALGLKLFSLRVTAEEDAAGLALTVR